MYTNVDLSSNGKIKNYPTRIPMKIIRIGQYRELVSAYKSSDRVFELTVTSVLDSLIDWSKVEHIKSVNELTKSDRLKLYFFEMINSIGCEFKLDYTCPKCESKVINRFDIAKFDENKLKNKVEPLVLKNENGEVSLIVDLPVYQTIFDFENKIEEHREDVFNKIKEMKESYFDILEEKKKLNKRRVYVSNFQNKDEVKRIDERIKELDVEIDKFISDETGSKDLNKKVQELLDQNYITVNDLDLIESKDDLLFDENVSELLVLYCYIKGNDRSVVDYIKFIDDMPYSFIEKIGTYLLETNHGINNEITMECDKCHNKVKDYVVLNCKFFFSAEGLSLEDIALVELSLSKVFNISHADSDNLELFQFKFYLGKLEEVMKKQGKK